MDGSSDSLSPASATRRGLQIVREEHDDQVNPKPSVTAAAMQYYGESYASTIISRPERRGPPAPRSVPSGERLDI